MAVGISKTPEGVAALRTLSSTMLTEIENVNKAHDTLKNVYDGVKNEVAHEEEINEILEDIRIIQAGVVVPIASLSKRVSDLANQLEAFLNGKLGGQGN